MSTPNVRRTRAALAFFPLLGSLVLLIGMLRGGRPPDPIFEVGSLGSVNGEQIVGWARDKDQPDSPVQVDVYEGDNLLATVLADEYRQDLFDMGMGNGKHGFTFPTPDRLKDGRAYQIRVKFSGTNSELANSPLTLTVIQVEGSVDGADSTLIAGWARNKGQPEVPIKVDIYDGSTLIATVPADQLREDLVEAKIGNGKYGFAFPTPPALRDGKAHTIRVVASGTNSDLDGSPKAVTLKSP
jgi:hypothetical protein